MRVCVLKVNLARNTVESGFYYKELAGLNAGLLQISLSLAFPRSFCVGKRI